MSESPEDFIERRHKKQTEKALGLLQNLPGDQVLFYPYGGLDWNPLSRLSHLCNIFVYAEPGLARADAVDAINSILTRPPLGAGFSRRQLELVKLSFAELKDLELVDDNAGLAEPMVIAIEIIRTVAGVERILSLFHINCCPIRAYQRLFTARHTAPRVLCLGTPRSPREQERVSWSGPLGTAVAANDKSEPDIVIRSREVAGWPWTKRWQEFAAWNEGRAYVTPFQAAMTIKPGINHGPREVIISRTQLTPENVGDADAVLINVPQLQQYRWPDSARVFVVAEAGFQPDARTRRLNPKFMPVQVAGLTLAEALRRLEGICELGKIKKLASNKLGIEDEGPVLEQWRATPGFPAKLILHCPLEGDVFSFGRFADRII